MKELSLLTSNRTWTNLKRAIFFTPLFIVASNLTGCGSIAGNVVPKSGPKMESVYDSMGNVRINRNGDENSEAASDGIPQKIKEIRKDLKTDISPVKQINYLSSGRNQNSFLRANTNNSISYFHKFPNPELRMYVYPHFAGNDEVPVPGYETAFNAYDHDYYGIRGKDQD